MMEAVDKTADTLKSIGYAVFHPKKTAKEVATTIKSVAEEKGGSYVGGYVLGEAAQAAALAGAGSTVKAAKASKVTKYADKKAEKVKAIEEVSTTEKTISYGDYLEIYERSIYNSESNKIMLGKYDGGGSTSYITKAGSEYTYFNLGSGWNEIKKKYGFSDDDMFKLFNEPFLDDGINAKKVFQFSHDPIGDKGALGREYKYLKENGYILDEENMRMYQLK